jgi:hypothetical protein
MQEIPLNNKEYLLVEVPDDATDFRYDSWFTRYINHSKGGIKLDVNTKIIGKISDILKDEDICKGLVESKRIKESWNSSMTTVYLNYIPKEDLIGIYCQQATDSFLSYLQSINLDLIKSWLLIQKL